MEKRKKRLIKGELLSVILVLGLFLVSGLVSAQDWPAFNVCCEKTKNGAWCQNTLEENCDTSTDPVSGASFRMTPTSCEATSFCNLGCCIDTAEGLCMKNTPQRVCQNSKGTWTDDPMCNVAQCNLGCCILGDQASFVTLTRCKRMSNLYGLATNFKREITNEAQCVLVAYSQDKGACVYEQAEGGRSCKFTTRADCSQAKLQNMTSEPEFFQDYLCSADELATDCGPTTKTGCFPGKDEVYFVDTCGNPANIYDANRIYSKDPGYWQKIVPKHESCGYKEANGDGNVNSKTCGNCNYLQGSLCGEGDAEEGDYICKDLNCYNTINGNNYKNGESWCVYQSDVGDGQDTVGSRHFRHVCIHGEETVEPCADFRNEVCIQERLDTSSGDFIEAACRVNRWQDCIDQYEERDCLNTDKRDCYWKEGFYYDGSQSKTQGNQTSEENLANEDSEKKGEGILQEEGKGICLPKNPPGLKFWEEGEAQGICSLGNSKQIVTFETNIFGTKKCKENCEVLERSWVDRMNEVCSSLGDCGAFENFAGRYTDYGLVWKQNGKRKTISEEIQ
jgi:hypothetical protein